MPYALRSCMKMYPRRRMHLLKVLDPVPESPWQRREDRPPREREDRPPRQYGGPRMGGRGGAAPAINDAHAFPTLGN